MSRKRIWHWPVAIGLCFLILAIFAWGALRKYQLDESSSATAIALLQGALTSKSADGIIASAHPDWLATMPAESIRSYFDSAIYRLGDLQAMNSITGESTAGVLPNADESIAASYVINLEMGTTTFDTLIDLRYEDGEWLISNLMLNAPILMD